MSHYLEYISPDGRKVTFDPRHIDGPYFLVRGLEGFMSNEAQLIERESPGQRGSTAIDVSISGRSPSIQVGIFGNSKENAWQLRQDLIDILNTEPPVRPGRISLGSLRVHRENRPSLVLDCLPHNSPQEVEKINNHDMVVDIEFRAPSPYWREQGMKTAILATDGGFTFPLEHPWESLANNVELTIVNEGSVSTPIRARLHGDFTNGRLWNLTYDEVIEFNGQVIDGDYIEVNTAFGNKSAMLYKANGDTENAMPNIDLSTTFFWSLRRGSNRILWEADTNISGRADLAWHVLRSGW